MADNKKPIEVALQLIEDGELSKEVAEKIFPELRESEDEKIIHAIELLIGQLDSGETVNGFTSSDMMRVLKSISCKSVQKRSKEDEEDINRLLCIMDDCYHFGKHSLLEDEKVRNRLIAKIRSIHTPETISEAYAILRDSGYVILDDEDFEELVSRANWAPTDKQMEAIRYLVEDYSPWTLSSRDSREELKAIYNELKNRKKK